MSEGKIRFTIITAFPEFFGDFLATSIIGRAVRNGLLEIEVLDLRAFGQGRYRKIDDYAFASGGMVLMAEPLAGALNAVRGTAKEAFRGTYVVYPTPQGVPLTQEIVETLSRRDHVVVVCGHYEGLDERFVEREVDLEVSMGDCVLTGGEIPAMALVDAVSRLIPGVVGKSGAVEEDSFYRGMLDHPHYTRPASWEGIEVPEVLLSGNSAKIEDWRRRQAAARTLARRPDLLARNSLIGYLRGGFYLALKCEEAGFNLGTLRELAGICESYDVARLFLILRDPGEREKVRRTLGVPDLWKRGRLKLMPSLAHVIGWIGKKDNLPPITGICVSERKGSRHWLEVKRLFLEKGNPVLLLLPGAKDETDGDIFDRCDVLVSAPQKGTLPLCAEAAAIVDRFLGNK